MGLYFQLPAWSLYYNAIFITLYQMYNNSNSDVFYRPAGSWIGGIGDQLQRQNCTSSWGFAVVGCEAILVDLIDYTCPHYKT